MNVLPDPVTPSRTCDVSPRFEPLDELVDRPRLIAAQLEIGDQLEAVVSGRHGRETARPIGANVNRRSYHRWDSRLGSDAGQRVAL